MSRARGAALPTVTVLLALLGLGSAVVVSAVDARHHGHPARTVAKSEPMTAARGHAVAQALRSFQLPPGIRHTTVCPQAATDLEACFAGSLPVTSSHVPAPFIQLLTSLGVTVQANPACGTVKRGPQGSGIICFTRGEWEGSPVSALALSRSAAHAPPAP